MRDMGEHRMTKAGYDNLKKSIKETYELSLSNLAKEYAYSNNPHKLGDIIQDKYSNVRIKIDKMRSTFDFHNKYPGCLYYGPELRKDNTPFKNGKRSSILQSRIGKVK